MSGIGVCAINQSRFFTFKNPEQAPNFDVLLQNQALLFEVLLEDRILFGQSGLKCLAQMSKSQLLSAFVSCSLMSSLLFYYT